MAKRNSDSNNWKQEPSATIDQSTTTIRNKNVNHNGTIALRIKAIDFNIIMDIKQETTSETTATPAAATTAPPMIEVVERKEVETGSVALDLDTNKYIKKITIRGGGYAILMSLYFHTKTNDDFLTKEEIDSIAKQYCNQPLVKHHPKSLVRELFGPWHGIDTIEKNHRLVIRTFPKMKKQQKGAQQSDRHHQFHLTSTGEYFVQRLLHERSKDIINATATSSSDTPDVVKARSLTERRTKSTNSKNGRTKGNNNSNGSNTTKTETRKKQGTLMDYYKKKENDGGGNNGGNIIKREDSPVTTTRTVPSSPTTNGKKRTANVVSPSPKKSKKMM